MTQCNADIRSAAMRAGVYQWEIAERLGIHEAVLSRRMRHELPADEKAKVMQAINDLSRTGTKT